MRRQLFPLLGILLVLGSCASPRNLFRDRNENWRGQPKATIRALAEGEAGAGPLAAEFASPLTPGVTFQGELALSPEGGFIFTVLEARLFGNWPNGWTEGRYEASGSLELKRDGGVWASKVRDGFKLWGIKEGAIRYYDKYYIRDDGTKKVKQRVDRMEELSSALRKGFGFRELYWEAEEKDLPVFEFREDALRLLFPERLDFEALEKEGRLAQNYKTGPEGPVLVRGDGLLWRSDYTKAVLAENFRELRDSGTLYRDFEETPGLWMALYNLPKLLELLDKGEPFEFVEKNGASR